jgi:ubiquinone/menaquinone biosynthesis C-methylase UbiE
MMSSNSSAPQIANRNPAAIQIKRILTAMPLPRLAPGVELQRKYYTETAPHYETMHHHEGADDPECRRFIVAILRSLQIDSLLDIGSATGRGLRELALYFPGAFVCGVEPVAALLRQSGSTNSISLLQASGDALPFADASFDAVTEFATLHHVANPAIVVKEMLRVARKVVVVADSNRFGQGSFPVRLLKLFLYKMRLWKLYDFLRTRGKYYQISEGDGLFYSYSVYDSYDLLADWSDRLLIFPAGTCDARASWFHPLLTAPGVILIAIRDSRTDTKPANS